MEDGDGRKRCREKEKGKKKQGAPDANPPAVVQLQVDPERTGALNLYLSRGFAVVRQISDYYCTGRDALYCELCVSCS